MKAQELRIGNLILFASEGIVFTVNSIEGYGMILSNKDEETWIEYDQTEPIPLTEDWLLKFGFEDKDHVDSSDVISYKNKDGDEVRFYEEYRFFT
jgi:hypothetical protein